MGDVTLIVGRLLNSKLGRMWKPP